MPYLGSHFNAYFLIKSYLAY